MCLPFCLGSSRSIPKFLSECGNYITLAGISLLRDGFFPPYSVLLQHKPENETNNMSRQKTFNIYKPCEIFPFANNDIIELREIYSIKQICFTTLRLAFNSPGNLVSTVLLL